MLKKIDIIKIITSIAILILVSSSLTFVYLYKQQKEVDLDNIITFEIIKSKNPMYKAELYYELENVNIYTYNIDQIILRDRNGKIDLLEAFEIDKDILNKMIIKFTREAIASYDDGGTRLYYGEDFNVLKCHTLSANNDIYIGNKDMGYLNSFCK